MALKKISRTDDEHKPAVRRLAEIAVSGVDRISVFYAAMAKILLGRFEDFSDFEAARRSRRLNLEVARQRAGGAKIRRPRR